MRPLAVMMGGALGAVSRWAVELAVMPCQGHFPFAGLPVAAGR
jgi:fluoride ion exporter CrcB/FEX